VGRSGWGSRHHKTLWRLLYENAARANEALSLNVEDRDIPNRRAAIRGKNSELDYLHWQTASGHLLSRLIAGRTAGPVFLTDRRAAPGRAPATADLCPQTGRARSSYRRAQELFAAASGGWTLHQLRHSALTHLAEENVSLALLMAKSRHTGLRSLQKYARRGVDAVTSSPPTTTRPAPTRIAPRPAGRAFADSDLPTTVIRLSIHTQSMLTRRLRRTKSRRGGRSRPRPESGANR
jgi:integrase